MLELYHWEPNGDSLKMIVALKEKGVAYTSHYVDLLALEHHGEAFKAAGDGGRVPLVVQNGAVLKDSQLALEYLAEAYGPRLAPTDPAGWYDIQDWTGFAGALGGNVRALGWHTVTAPGMSEAERKDFLDRSAKLPKPPVMAGWAQVTSDAEASEDQLRLARERIADAVARIETQLAGKDWLVGVAYSVADINVFAHAHVLPRLLPDVVNAKKTPNTMAWLKRVGDRPAVQDAFGVRRSSGTGDVYAPMV
jgi:glutathione S-transferase/GST-like protein